VVRDAGSVDIRVPLITGASSVSFGRVGGVVANGIAPHIANNPGGPWAAGGSSRRATFGKRADQRVTTYVNSGIPRPGTYQSRLSAPRVATGIVEAVSCLISFSMS
jgi:hypothetical protein